MSIHAANLKLRDELFTAKKAIQRVRDLHKPASWCCAMCDGAEEKRCAECFNQPYPCPTIKVLDGEQG